MSQTPCPLSERELEVLRLLAKGASNQEIARDLVISVNTVKVHVRNIFEKLNVQSRTEATFYAIREGWIPVNGVTLPSKPEEAQPEVQPSRWRAILSGRRPVMALLIVVFAGLLPLVWLLRLTQENIPRNPTPASTESRRWSERASLPTARSGLALTTHAGQVYAIAGETADGVTGAVERYDPVKDAWVSLTSKPTPVKDAGAAVVGGRIYVPGGCDADNNPIATMEVYNPESDAWITETPLPTPLCAYAIAALEGRIYLFGGWNGTAYTNETWQYSPEPAQWTPKAPMPTARAYAGAAVVEGKIYVLGGYDGSDLTANQVYEPSKDNDEEQPWTELTPLPEGRGAPGVTSLGSIIYVVGGGWKAPRESTLQYDVRKDAWQAFEPALLHPWRSLGLVAIDTKLYAVGGWSNSYVNTNAEYVALYRIFIPARPE